MKACFLINYISNDQFINPEYIPLCESLTDEYDLVILSPEKDIMHMFICSNIKYKKVFLNYNFHINNENYNTAYNYLKSLKFENVLVIAKQKFVNNFAKCMGYKLNLNAGESFTVQI